MESDWIRADVVEVTEFPHLANKYRVMGVPMTVVNEKPAIEGAVPEGRFVDAVLAAVNGGGG
jgi:predicted DsbA family dithiol-disulfide isomerase